MRTKSFILSIIVLFLVVGAILSVAQGASAAPQLLRATATRTPTKTAIPTLTFTPTITPVSSPGAPTPTPSFSDFTGSPLSGVAPLTVTFVGRYGPVYNCTWTFGDGTTKTYGPIGASGYQVCPSTPHTYTAAGSYTVSLRVSTMSGVNFTTTKTNYITVTAP